MRGASSTGCCAARPTGNPGGAGASRRPKTRAKPSAKPSAAAATETARPVSAASEVAGHPRRPQGTMRENQARSVEAFSARPCEVTQREIRTPIEASLRASPAGSHQTPVMPGRRPAATPNRSAARIPASSSARR